MLKRFRRQNQDASDGSTGRDSTSPQASPSSKRAGDGNNSNKTEIEGFVCPVCMVSFANVETLQNHFESAHGDGAPPPSKTEETNAKNGGATVGNKTKPNEAINSPSMGKARSSSFLSMHQEMNDLRKSLKEEIWYSAELKKEYDRLENEITKLKADKNNRRSLKDEEYALMSEQLKVSEESRAMLTSEMRTLQEELNSMSSERTAYMHQIQEFKKHISGMTSEKQTLQDRLAHNESELKSLRLQVETFKSSSDANRSADDNLRCEVIALQTQIEMKDIEITRLNQNIDKLKESFSGETQLLRDQVKKQEGELAERHDRLAATERQLTEARDQLVRTTGERDTARTQLDSRTEATDQSSARVSELEGQLRELERTWAGRMEAKEGELKAAAAREKQLAKEGKKLQTKLDEACQEVAEYKGKLNKVDESMQQKVSESLVHTEALEKSNRDREELNERLEEAVNDKEHLATELKTSRDKLNEVEIILQQKESELEQRNSSIEELSTKLKGVENSVEHMKQERQELLGKIEMEDAAATLVSQLQSEKEKLLIELKDSQTLLSEKENHFRGQLDKSKQESQELKRELEAVKKTLEDLNESVKRTEEKLEKKKKIIGELQMQLDAEKVNASKTSTLLQEANNLLEEKTRSYDHLTKTLEELEAANNECKLEWEREKDDLIGENKRMKEDLKVKCEVETKLKSSVDECSAQKGVVQKLEDQLKSLTSDVDSLNNDLARTKRELDERTCSLNASKEEVVLAQNNLTSLREELRSLESKLEVEKKASEKVRQEAAVLTAELADTQSKLESANSDVSNVSTKLSQSEQLCCDLKSELHTEKGLYADKEKLEEMLTHKINKLHESKLELSEKLKEAQAKTEELQAHIEERTADIMSKEDLLVGNEEKIQSLDKTILRKEEEIRHYEKKLVAIEEKSKAMESSLRADLASLTGDKTRADEELKDAQSQLEERALALDTVRGEAARVASELDEERQRVVVMQEEKERLETVVVQLESRVEELQEGRARLQEERISLENGFAAKEEGYKEQMDVLNQRLQEIEETKDNLLDLKLSAERRAEELQQALDAHVKSDEDAQEMQDILREENARLQSALDEENGRSTELSRDLESERHNRESEMAHLRSQLAASQSDLSRVQSAYDEISAAHDHTSAEKLELQLKLETSVEEKHGLMERVICAEDTTQQLEEKLISQKRELDHLQAAILDLGRENQSLQITREKLTTRQWISDEEVLTCNGCQRAFSVTIRRHHCRSCGTIFCNECSSKYAPTASSKKPVRVCDPCYGEIISNRRASVTLSSTQSLNT